MQQLMFYLMIDVQDVVEKTQKAKESLGPEVQGFDDENYSTLQAIRIEQAQRALQDFRRIKIGVP